MEGRLKNRAQELRRYNFKANRESNLMGHIDSIPLRNLSFNTLGYAVTGNFSKNGLKGTNLLVSTNAEILGGALNLNYSCSTQKLNCRQELNFRHMYELDHRWIRQFSAFRQSGTLLMSDLGGYANGIYLSNGNAMFSRYLPEPESNSLWGAVQMNGGITLIV